MLGRRKVGRLILLDVFVAGDIAYGTRLLIDAVASGKRAARSVYQFVTSLTNNKLKTDQVVLHLPIMDYAREADYEKQQRLAVPRIEPAERVQSQATLVESGYTPEMAMCEAGRCLDCGVNTIFDSEKCILCGGCADVCPELCLELVSLDRLMGDELLQHTLSERAGDNMAQFSAIVKDETRCIRCGLCAERCPTNAITMERLTVLSTWKIES